MKILCKSVIYICFFLTNICNVPSPSGGYARYIRSHYYSIFWSNILILYNVHTKIPFKVERCCFSRWIPSCSWRISFKMKMVVEGCSWRQMGAMIPRLFTKIWTRGSSSFSLKGEKCKQLCFEITSSLLWEMPGFSQGRQPSRWVLHLIDLGHRPKSQVTWGARCHLPPRLLVSHSVLTLEGRFQYWSRTLWSRLWHCKLHCWLESFPTNEHINTSCWI